jgi:multicomponent Na+:H+ antiporter subunit B
MKINLRIKLGYLGLVLILVLLAPEFIDLLSDYNSFSYDYFTVNTLSEIGSKNVVTGIYLDYRLFDSLFEAGILFVVAAAILFMGKEDKKEL